MKMLMVLAAAVVLVAQSDLPVLRVVKGQTITSNSLPRAAVTFDAAFRYAGGQRFTLYGVADAEQHFFVDADANHKIRRFYWLQFEHYLPDNNHRYDYRSDQVIRIGGLSFLADTRIYTDYSGVKPRPDSDSARGRALLAAKGFQPMGAVIRARLVHLPSSDNRSELMIIYAEALSPGELPTDAKNEMTADGRYPDLAARVLEHAKQGLKLLE